MNILFQRMHYFVVGQVGDTLDPFELASKNLVEYEN